MSMLTPRTLFGRNVLLIFVLIVLAELTGAVLYQQLVQKPRAEQLAGIVVRNLLFLRTVLNSVPQPQRAAFISQLNAEAGIEIATHPPLDVVERRLFDLPTLVFANLLAAQLHASADQLRWQAAQGGSLWIPFEVAHTPYWIGIHNLRIDRARWMLWLGVTLLTTLLALSGAYLIQRRINRPLNHLVEAARSVASGQLPMPLPESGPTEIVTVSNSFNHMMHSLAQMDRERALMLAGVSHDLRTPLTKLRLGLEIMRDNTEVALTVSMDRSIAEMDAIIDQFMDFARLPGASEQHESVDLNQLIHDCAQAYAERGYALQLELAPLKPLHLHRRAVERVLINLLENAINYGAPEFGITTRMQDNFVQLSVLDRGPGIAATEMTAMKKPFVRGSSARAGKAGAGLGLAIVERIAQSHGGELLLESRIGGGLEAKIKFKVIN